MIVNKSNIKLGMYCYVLIDDRPFDKPIIHECIITEIRDDCYLYDELMNGEVFIDGNTGFYDDDINSSVVVFTTKKAAEDCLRKRG